MREVGSTELTKKEKTLLTKRRLFPSTPARETLSFLEKTETSF